MKGFPVELLFVLAFIGIVLFNYLMQRAARRRQAEEAQGQPEPSPVPEAALEDVWGRTPVPVPAAPVVARPAPVLARAAPPAPRRTHPLHARLRDKRELRRAITLMTVLGPCRAQQPPER